MSQRPSKSLPRRQRSSRTSARRGFLRPLRFERLEDRRVLAGEFTDVSAGLPDVNLGSVAWGDYDNDGDLDILGGDRVYQNTSGTFSDISAGITGVRSGSVPWGDYDNDGDLDILLTGFIGGASFVSRVYQNNSTTANSVPAAPSGLTATINSATSVTLAWTATSDTQTPSDGLSYNLRVSTTPGGSDIVGSMSFQNPPSSQTDGLRKIGQRGLVQGTSWTLENLPPGQTYYWSVQAVDTAHAGSPFGTEGSFGTFFDFGDAPDAAGGSATGNPYPTLLEHDGAFHIIGPLFLGTSVDAESDGQPNATATGDDLAGSDDENGVTFTSLLILGELTKVTVNASVAGGLLDAWVDFNDDGAWAHPGEQIFTSQPLAAGDNLLSFAVPAGLSLGAQTFARFRVSTAGGLAPTGLAANGEVEDYQVTIQTVNRFTVNSTADTGDANAGNGTCADGGGNCTFRAALQEANALTNLAGGPDVIVITFNIPGAGPHSITPTSALPVITGTVVIDGTSEPDFVPGGPPVIELNGTVAGARKNGLFLTAGNSTVRGLVINRFTGAGIRLQTGGNNTIAGNFIGTDQTGMLDRGNGGEGILVAGSGSNTIGGVTAADRNVISGNGRFGVELDYASSTNNLVRGNYIGTNRQGTAALANSLSGVILYNAPSNTIDGTAAGAGNVISGNDRNGVEIDNPTGTNNIVRGNFIGTNFDGTAALGNTLSGVLIFNAGSNTIGGTANGAGNTIGFNGSSGVRLLETGKRNAIQRNSIFSNTGLGIDLPTHDFTGNDAGDADTGANNLQNFPEMTVATIGGGNVNVTYSVPSTTANSAYSLTIEFFRTDANRQEGQTFLGSDTYPAGSATLADMVTFAPAGAVNVGDRIVATATDANGNTSEFSVSIKLAAALRAAGGESIPAPGIVQAPRALTSADLPPIVDAAIARVAAQGLSA